MCITKRRQKGISLVELVMFIVIVGVGIVGVMSAFNVSVRGSADPMVRKQALAIAESLLLEVEQQAFTWCDPQDASVLTVPAPVAGPPACAVAANDQNKAGGAFPVAAPAPTPASETRGGLLDPYDNVSDYAGFHATGAGVLADYASNVTITRAGAAAPFAALPLDAVLRIAVTVAGRGETVTLVGYRFRYAPNAPG